MRAPLIDLLVRLEALIGRAFVAVFAVAAAFARHIAALAQSLAARFGAMPTSTRLRLGYAALAVFFAGVLWQTRDPIVNWYEATAGKRPLLAARNWQYHLDKQDPVAIHRHNADLLVIDYATNGGRNPYSAADVTLMKSRTDGSRRLVVAYLSVGEAETFRFYWKSDWEGADAKRPSWLLAPNCAWPGAWAVRYWDPGWKDILYRSPQSYLKRIIDQGFDGVYLDRVDMFEHLANRKGIEGIPADPESAMVDVVIDLAETARRWKPGFLIIPQNGETLLRHKRYRRAIDGLGKEDLLYGNHGTGERNAASDINWSVTRMRRLLDDLKPVFAVEYLVTREAIANATMELTQLGLIPTFQDRSLDGTDPVMPRFDAKPTEGTPEWIKSMCDKSNSW